MPITVSQTWTRFLLIAIATVIFMMVFIVGRGDGLAGRHAKGSGSVEPAKLTELRGHEEGIERTMEGELSKGGESSHASSEEDSFFPFGDNPQELRRSLGDNLAARVGERRVREFLLSWSPQDPIMDGTIPYAQLGIVFGSERDAVLISLEDRIYELNKQLESMVEPIQQLAGEAARTFADPRKIVSTQTEALNISAQAVRESGGYSRSMMLRTVVSVGRGYLPFGFNSANFPILQEGVEEANRLRRERKRIIETMRALLPVVLDGANLGTATLEAR